MVLAHDELRVVNVVNKDKTCVIQGSIRVCWLHINGCSEWGNSDSILDMICSSTIHIPAIKKQKNTF